MALMLGEASVLTLFGAMAGVALSFVATWALERLPTLAGVYQASYPSTVFWRGLYTGLGMALIGAAYPAIRAGLVVPLRALNRALPSSDVVRVCSDERREVSPPQAGRPAPQRCRLVLPGEPAQHHPPRQLAGRSGMPAGGMTS